MMKSVCFGLALISASVLLGSPIGNGVAAPAHATAYTSCPASTNTSCEMSGRSAYWSCVHSPSKDPGGMYDYETSIRDCPLEGQTAYEGCMYSGGCSYDDFPGVNDFPWNH